MTISVVMCTHNGCPFVRDQVRSIITQLAPSDELIVCDDKSTDATVAVIQSEAQTAGVHARIVVNDEQLGIVQNVEAGVSLAARDIVVLADQDDLWRHDKLRVIRERFRRDPELIATFSDATLIDEVGQPLGRTLWAASGVTGTVRKRIGQGRAFEQLMRRNVVTGATVAFRRELLRTALPFPQVTMHDYWLALVGSCTGAVAAIDQPLIAYRAHPAQLVGPEPPDVRGQLLRRRREPGARRAELEMFEALRDRLADQMEPRRLATLDSKVAFLARRADLSGSVLRRIPAVVADVILLRYHRFGRGLRSAGRDILLGH